MIPIALPVDSIPIRTHQDIEEVEAQGWPQGLPESTYALIAAAAAIHGHLPAMTFFEDAARFERAETISYRDLFARVTQTANLFHALGVRSGDVVAIILPNLPEMHFSLWGAEAAGVALPINPALDRMAMAGMLESARAKVIVTLAPDGIAGLYETVTAAAKDGAGDARIILVDRAGDAGGHLRTDRCDHAGPIPFSSSMASQRAAALDNPRPPMAGDTSSLFGTGGTTGAPKLARRTHANEVANTWMSARLLGSGLRCGDVIFSGLPLFHVNGALVTGLVPFLRGANILIGTASGYRAPGLLERFWRIVAHYRVTCFSGVPTVFAGLLQHPVGDADVASLRFGICGAAPLPPEIIDRFTAATRIPILEGYGLTESTCVVAINPYEGEQKVGSVGLPIPFQQVSIAVDPKRTITQDPSGEIGRVLIRGPNVFQGYVDPRHDAGIWVDPTDGGARWLDTGDLGLTDGDGYLWLKGRSKDLIIRGGHNLDPQMIEEAFYRHPAVGLAAAIGRPDPYAGEIPVIYVQLIPGTAVSAEALLDHCAKFISDRAARPKVVRIVETLPLTSVGKVFKPALREMERAFDEPPNSPAPV